MEQRETERSRMRPHFSHPFTRLPPAELFSMITSVTWPCSTLCWDLSPPRPRSRFTSSRQPCRPTRSARRSPRRLYLRLNVSRLACASPGSCRDSRLEPCSPSNVPAMVRRAAACRRPKEQVRHSTSPSESARARGASSASPERRLRMNLPCSGTPVRAAHRQE